MGSEQIQREALALPEAERMDLTIHLLQNGKPVSAERPELKPAEASADLRKIYKAALALPEAERDELCRKLLLSLEPQEGLVSEEEAEAYWIQEAERRLARRQRGEVELIPYEQVLRELGESLP